MSLTKANLDADLDTIIAEFPQSFTFGGTSYVCAADDITEGRNPAEAGVFADDALTLHVRTALFTGTRPVSGNKITYSSRTFRIVSVFTSVDDNMLRLTCEEETA